VLRVITDARTLVTYFETKRTEQDILLTWATEDEGEIDHFEITRSVDGKSYSLIHKVTPKSTGRSSNIYEYIDQLTDVNRQETQRVYYKISEVVNDGVPQILATATSLTRRSSSRQVADIQDLLPQTSPKSPNVSAMERYGNSPISLYTGQPTIEIPIWDIKVGDMTVPIKLSYHPGGHKVMDVAPWTGMGWSLTGVYAITREQRGRPDEVSGLINEELPSYSSPITCLTEDLKEDLNQHVDFEKDLERDVFTYRTASKSNSFILKPSEVIFLASDKAQITYSSPPNLLGSITVNDENGNRYTYAQKESAFSNNQSGTSTWHLTELLTNKPGQKLVYNYHHPLSFTYNSNISYSETYYSNVCGDTPVSGGFQSETTIPNHVTVTSRSPKEIFFPEGKIEFVQEDEWREDGHGKALDKIKVYSYNFTSNSYTLIKQYDLSYLYKNREGGGKALFLDKVEMLGTDDTIIGEYSLAYNNLALPSKTSLAKDHWGYFNGQTGNTSLLIGI